MAKLEFSLKLPDCLAREAREAGLFKPEALTEMLESGLRQKAAERVRAARAVPGGGQPHSPAQLQKVVAEVRRQQL